MLQSISAYNCCIQITTSSQTRMSITYGKGFLMNLTAYFWTVGDLFNIYDCKIFYIQFIVNLLTFKGEQ